MKSPRYKITVTTTDGQPKLFSQKGFWSVVDTITGEKTGQYETARDALVVAKKMERK